MEWLSVAGVLGLRSGRMKTGLCVGSEGAMWCGVM